MVYGTVCLDRFLPVDAAGEPLPGDAGAIRELPGGEAFNTATALAGWGVSVLLTGTAIGSDDESDRLRRQLATSLLASGIDFGLLPDIPDAVTPVCTVRVFPNGERRMAGRGFAQAVAPPPLPSELLASRPLFITDPNLGEPAIRQALSAHSAGCLVLAMDFADTPEIVAISRILVTSHERLARQGFADRTPESIALHLREMGAQTAIITLGEQGCVVADREEGVFTQVAFPISSILDTTGAGDTFRAGLAWGLLHTLPIRETVRFATAAAALHCTVLGGGSRSSLDAIRTLVG